MESSGREDRPRVTGVDRWLSIPLSIVLFAVRHLRMEARETHLGFEELSPCPSFPLRARVRESRVGIDFAAFPFVLEAERAVFSSEGLRRSLEGFIPSVEGRVHSLEALNPSVEGLRHSMEWLVASAEGLAPLAEGLVPLAEGLIPSTKRMRQFVSVSRP